VILATQEAEIRRIIVAKPASTNSSRDPILKKPITEIDWWSGLRCRHCKTPALEKKKKRNRISRKQIRIADLDPNTSIIHIKCKWAIKTEVLRLEGDKTNSVLALNMNTDRLKVK
jgi:hypothetical protein